MVGKVEIPWRTTSAGKLIILGILQLPFPSTHYSSPLAERTGYLPMEGSTTYE